MKGYNMTIKCKNRCDNDAVLNAWDNEPTFGGECRPCAFNLTGIETICSVCAESYDLRYIRDSWGGHSNICTTCIDDAIEDMRYLR
jgi:hypothetical protein|tara:strand:- start:672 stop:929 length:258 start_codon:yes stop_codon:yes gene_type:complete